VDAICTYVELQEGIDVLSIIGKIDHPIVLVGWSNVLIFAAFFSLNSFKTIPNFVFCDSKEICSCNLNAYELYQDVCDAVANGTDISNSTALALDPEGNLASSSLGEIADMTTLVIAVLVMLCMVLIIFFSLFMIQRRKEKKDLKDMEDALKAKEVRTKTSNTP